ncbi:hypothetical protein PATSB16_35370 [Pandoraea thiooxydans]|nr:hypothetical protein PATSB16_35370 [Pandoraea thiooxydans]
MRAPSGAGGVMDNAVLRGSGEWRDYFFGVWRSSGLPRLDAWYG